MLCPQCHRPFEKELEEKEYVNREFVTVPGEPSALRGATRPTAWQPYYVRKELSRYRYHYKCKHCGHEWTETKIEERDAP
jgi:hypothetical protein